MYTLNDDKGLDIALAIATALYVLLNITVIYYFIIFQKKEFLERYINKKYLFGIFTSLNIPLPFLIASYVVGFSQFDASDTVIGLIVVVFIFLIGVGFFLFFGLQYITIGIDKKEISFLGERIVVGNITSIDKNEKTKRLIINYNVGSRSKKKWRFILSSPAANFIINNIEILNQSLMEI